MKLKHSLFLGLTFVSSLALSSCNFTTEDRIKITNGDELTIEIGESITLECDVVGNVTGTVVYSEDPVGHVNIEGNVITGRSEGTTTVTAALGTLRDHITVNITKPIEVIPDSTLTISAAKYTLEIDEELDLTYSLEPALDDHEQIVYHVKSGQEVLEISNARIRAIKPGIAQVYATIGEITSNILSFVVNAVQQEISLSITASKTTLEVNESTKIIPTISPSSYLDSIEYVLHDSDGFASINNDTLTALKPGLAHVYAVVNDVRSNVLTFTINEPVTLQIYANTYSLLVDESVEIKANVTPTSLASRVLYYTSSSKAYIEGNVLYATSVGTIEVYAMVEGVRSNTLTFTISNPTISISISSAITTLDVGQSTPISYSVVPSKYASNLQYYFEVGSSLAYINNHTLYATAKGSVKIHAYIDDVISNTLSFTINEVITGDPYVDVDPEEFYNNYTPASSYQDSIYRTNHFLMSGDIEVPGQYAEIATNQPRSGDYLIRNSSSYYSQDNNAYSIVDKNNTVVTTIYKGAAYISLEEVAAYVFAFNEIPANYVSSNKTRPTQSEWGIYLRLNHVLFSGDVAKYPYEPILPNISGCGGEYDYYEMDIGTTGTTTPGYDPSLYNNGSTITRGAARIVYSRYDKNGDGITDINEKYLFYTDNHYNDFQEYLNYYNGWGEYFGNMTGGGDYSSTTNYNPTPYVEVVRRPFPL